MRKLDLDALDAVQGGMNMRSLQGHLPGAHDPQAYVPGGHGAYFDPFGTHAATPAYPHAPVPVQPLPVVQAPAPAPAAAAAAATNPLGQLAQQLPGLLSSLTKAFGGNTSAASSGAAAHPAATNSNAGHAPAGNGGGSHSFTPSHSVPSHAATSNAEDNPRPASLPQSTATSSTPAPFGAGAQPVPYLNNPWSTAAQPGTTASANPTETPFGTGAQPVPYLNDPWSTAAQAQQPGANTSFNPEAPHIDTTGVQPLYTDAQLAQNRADTFGTYQDSASPQPTGTNSYGYDAGPTGTNSGSVVASAPQTQTYNDGSSFTDNGNGTYASTPNTDNSYADNSYSGADEMTV